MVKLKIDNFDVEVPAGTSILDAARQAHVEIPTLCKHPDVDPSAGCGMCIVKVNGRIYYSLSKEVIFSGKVSGEMILEDGYTLEEVPYPFEVQIEQVLADYSSEEAEKKCKRTKNTLDLKEVLWENIVLEVPIVVSKDNKVKTKKGEFWEVRDENSKKDDPRLECFRTLLDEGKE